MGKYRYEEDGYYFGHRPEVVVMQPVVINTSGDASESIVEDNGSSEVVGTKKDEEGLRTDEKGIIYDSGQSVILKKRKLF